MKTLSQLTETAKKLNRKTVFTKQIPQPNGFIGILSNREYSFKEFTGSTRKKISSLHDVNYIEKNNL